MIFVGKATNKSMMVDLLSYFGEVPVWLVADLILAPITKSQMANASSPNMAGIE